MKTINKHLEAIKHFISWYLYKVPLGKIRKALFTMSGARRYNKYPLGLRFTLRGEERIIMIQTKSGDYLTLNLVDGSCNSIHTNRDIEESTDVKYPLSMLDIERVKIQKMYPDFEEAIFARDGYGEGSHRYLYVYQNSTLTRLREDHTDTWVLEDTKPYDKQTWDLAVKGGPGLFTRNSPREKSILEDKNISML